METLQQQYLVSLRVFHNLYVVMKTPLYTYTVCVTGSYRQDACSAIQ